MNRLILILLALASPLAFGESRARIRPSSSGLEKLKTARRLSLPKLDAFFGPSSAPRSVREVAAPEERHKYGHLLPTIGNRLLDAALSL